MARARAAAMALGVMLVAAVALLPGTAAICDTNQLPLLKPVRGRRRRKSWGAWQTTAGLMGTCRPRARRRDARRPWLGDEHVAS